MASGPQQQSVVKLSFRGKRIKIASPIAYIHLIQGADRLLASVRAPNPCNEDDRGVLHVHLYAGKHRVEITKQSDWEYFTSRHAGEQVFRVSVEASFAKERRFVRDDDADSLTCVVPPPAPASPPSAIHAQDVTAFLLRMSQALVDNPGLAQEVGEAVHKVMVSNPSLVAQLQTFMCNV
ncbi:hypothetical protein BASA81_000240 [Batrachochytrium salamandrivorans]|nr:hypothetical protein BASA81_000240 [Batrachochytrium salamandrivorans]